MDRHYTTERGAELRLFTLDEKPAGRILRGKALYNDHESEMTFVENAPRGARSVEVGRGRFGRCVRRPDGLYTVTMRIDAGTKYLRSAMICDIGDFATMILRDVERVNRKSKCLTKNT